MLIKKHAYFIFSTLLLLAVGTTNIFSQKLNAELIKDLTIGFREDSTEYMFSRIRRVCTDKQLNIYIADNSSASIRVFNEYGVFLKQIGRRGQGPGEIAEVTDMKIDIHNNLLVSDRRNKRITLFPQNGSKAITHPYKDPNCKSPWYINQLSDSTYFLYYWQVRRLEEEKTCDVFHIYDSKFENIICEFNDNGIIWDRSDPFDVSSIGNYGISLAFLSDEIFWFVPHIYTGKIFQLQKTLNSWQTTVFPGLNPKAKSRIYLDLKKFLDFKNRSFKKSFPKNTLARSGPLGRYLVRVLRATRGLFVLNDELVVHFSQMHKKGDVFIQIVEFFTKNGEFLGYHQYDEIDLAKKNHELIIWDALAKDSKDRFYFKSVYKGVPVIIRMKLEYSFD